MRYFVAHASPKTLVLIDEFGTGTDPQFGGPMAEAVLEAVSYTHLDVYKRQIMNLMLENVIRN